MTCLLVCLLFLPYSRTAEKELLRFILGPQRANLGISRSLGKGFRSQTILKRILVQFCDLPASLLTSLPPCSPPCLSAHLPLPINELGLTMRPTPIKPCEDKRWAALNQSTSHSKCMLGGGGHGHCTQRLRTAGGSKHTDTAASLAFSGLLGWE